MRQIKRYPNRKLYDTAQKRYVTLNDIARLIRDGYEVQVTDHSSGEDLTTITLTQIIFEQEKRQAGFLPQSVLTGLIQAGGERLVTLRRALALPLGMRHHVDEEIERRLNLLAAEGELDDEIAAEVREKLLGRRDGERAATAWEGADRDVEWLLAQKQIPSRSDLAIIEAQLEQLNRQIDALLEDQQ